MVTVPGKAEVVALPVTPGRYGSRKTVADFARNRSLLLEARPTGRIGWVEGLKRCAVITQLNGRCNAAEIH